MSLDELFTDSSLIPWGGKTTYKPVPRLDLVCWDDAREAKLRKLHAEGLSAGRIAAIFGDCTRNAIIGKLHRLGIRRLHTPSKTSTASRCAAMGLKPTRRTERPTPRKISRLDGEFKTAKKFERPAAVVPEFKRAPVPVMPVEEIQTVGVDIIEIKDHQCRWPLGATMDPASLFCGRQKAHGISYCDQHARRAFQPPQVRRRLKEIP
jgi:GcrA cell cycle regulator